MLITDFYARFFASQLLYTDFSGGDFPLVVEHEKVDSGWVSLHVVRVIAGVCRKSVDERTRHVVDCNLGVTIGIDEL